MDTDQTEQLNQCLAALASSQQHWWDALAITQEQADQLSGLTWQMMGAAIVYMLIVKFLNKA
jgi:hypothetical protein